MSLQPHETPAFQNAVRYAVVVTFTVADGARRRTAERRARKVAERLANAAARAAGVVEVTAVAGVATEDESGARILTPERVRFAAANSGQGTYGEPGKLDRYLDPEHERALVSLRAANEAYRTRQRADRERRAAVGCANQHRVGLPGDRCPCECVYCRPQDHLAARELAAEGAHWWAELRCVCGSRASAGVPCLRHRGVRVVALAGDPAALCELAALSGEQLR